MRKEITNSHVYAIILHRGWRIIFVIIVIFLLLILSRYIAEKIKIKFVEKNNMYYDEDTEKIGNLIKEIIFYGLGILSFQIGFYILGIDLSWLSGGLTLALGLFMSEMIKNIFSGIMMLSSKTIKLGKYLTIQTSKDTRYTGKLTNIYKTYSTLLTIAKEVVIVPNKFFVFYPLKMIDGKFRLDFRLQINHDSPFEEISKKLISSINELPFVITKEFTKVLIEEITITDINVLIWIYYKPIKKYNILEAKSKVYETILNTMKEYDIHGNYNERIFTVDKNDKVLMNSGIFLMNYYKKQQSLN